MKKYGLKVVSAVFALMLSAHASSALIVDTIEQQEYVNYWESYSYTHNIIDDLNQTGNFTLGTDIAIGGFLEIDIFDQTDPDCLKFFCLPDSPIETIIFKIEEADFDTGGITFGDFEGELEFNALLELNTDGMLDVTITSLVGDFYVGNSVLTVETASASVPEPASLALLGLGLAGLGFARRRQAAA